jgi:hypothetical protein
MSRILIRNHLWKSVDNSRSLAMESPVDTKASPAALRGESGAPSQTLRACSACAGDYEDPDRTAWTPDLDDDDPSTEAADHENSHKKAGAGGELIGKFPAQKE